MVVPYIVITTVSFNIRTQGLRNNNIRIVALGINPTTVVAAANLPNNQRRHTNYYRHAPILLFLDAMRCE